jgi:hypothetical protein
MDYRANAKEISSLLERLDQYRIGILDEHSTDERRAFGETARLIDRA